MIVPTVKDCGKRGGEDRQGRLRVRRGRWESPRGTSTEGKADREAGAWFNGTVDEVRRVVRPVLLDVPTRFSAMRHALKRDYGINQIPTICRAANTPWTQDADFGDMTADFDGKSCPRKHRCMITTNRGVQADHTPMFAGT